MDLCYMYCTKASQVQLKTEHNLTNGSRAFKWQDFAFLILVNNNYIEQMHSNY